MQLQRIDQHGGVACHILDGEAGCIRDRLTDAAIVEHDDFVVLRQLREKRGVPLRKGRAERRVTVRS